MIVSNQFPSQVDIARYRRIQKKNFFSKADNKLPIKKNTPTKDQIYKIFQEYLGKKPAEVIQLARSTLHDIFRVRVGGKNYLLKINLLNDVYQELHFFCEMLIPFVDVYLVDVSRIIVPFDYKIT